MYISPAETRNRLQSLMEINQLLMREVGTDEVLRVILDAATRLFEAEGCSLALLDEPAQQLAFVAMAGPAAVEEFRIDVGQGIAGWVVQMGQGVVVNDVSRDGRFFCGVDRQTGFTTQSILCVPLRQHGRTIGVFEAMNTTRAEGFTTDDLGLLSIFAGWAASAITRSQMLARVRNVGAAFRDVVQERYRLVTGHSPIMQELLHMARMVAATNTTVLLLGESGTGKEVLARAIHQWSPRAAYPFVTINCVALTPDLLASELFGHERGAFTGAVTRKLGKFELAEGGTVFLDEIGDLAPELQTKLLRVVQDKEFQRVGGVRDIRTNVRIVAATNRNLRQAMQHGMFREDLYYRLNVIAMTLPALRDRRQDIPELVQHFLDYHCRELSRPRMWLTPSALHVLQSYHWPGNVRELQNVIERLVVLVSGPDITASDLPADIRQTVHTPEEPSDPLPGLDDPMSLTEAVNAFKRAKVQWALQTMGGNQTLAAKLLGLQPSNLSRLMYTLGLRR